MAKKSNRNTRGRIVSAAWKLFYEQGMASMIGSSIKVSVQISLS